MLVYLLNIFLTNSFVSMTLPFFKDFPLNHTPAPILGEGVAFFFLGGEQVPPSNPPLIGANALHVLNRNLRACTFSLSCYGLSRGFRGIKRARPKGGRNLFHDPLDNPSASCPNGFAENEEPIKGQSGTRFRQIYYDMIHRF